MPRPINPTTINGMFVGFNTIFNGSYEAQRTPVLDAIAMKTTSTGSSEKYGWMKEIYGFKEWVGDRKFQPLDSNGYEIVNKRYSDGVAVNRDAISDDKFGVFNPTIAQIGTNGKLDPEFRILDHIVDGFSLNSYDATTMFGTHTWKGKSFTNHFSDALSRAAYIFAITEITKIVGQKGTKGEQPLMTNPKFTLLVSPDNYIEALEIVRASTLEQGGTNVLNLSAEVLQTALLGPNAGAASGTDASNYWFVAVSNSPGGIKPMIYQERDPMKTTQLIAPTDDSVFRRNNFEWAADMRYGFGYGFWQLMFASNSAAS